MCVGCSEHVRSIAVDLFVENSACSVPSPPPLMLFENRLRPLIGCAIVDKRLVLHIDPRLVGWLVADELFDPVCGLLYIAQVATDMFGSSHVNSEARARCAREHVEPRRRHPVTDLWVLSPALPVGQFDPVHAKPIQRNRRRHDRQRQMRFFTTSSVKVDSTKPIRAALKAGWQVRTHWSVIRSPSKTAVDGCVGIPAAEQSMCNVAGPVEMDPCSSRISLTSMAMTRPRRITPSIRRSRASSPSLRMAQ